MKALLWLLLLVALGVNISSSFLLDGAPQALVSVASGLTALGAGLALYLTRKKAA
ncbi:hypothetical protein [Streptomyces sp. NPDC002564]|uniref:hypothetical protein n=1 Tax=Streptomyces sp. NPDC002564 TaxID=3364649 RepID=UPI003683636A